MKKLVVGLMWLLSLSVVFSTPDYPGGPGCGSIDCDFDDFH